MNGIELIAAERKRQMEVEGWTIAHDDGHAGGEMASAAACYAEVPHARKYIAKSFSNAFNDEGDRVPCLWPWDGGWWKPTPDDRVRELVKAGALIAAEIDRLIRAEAGVVKNTEGSR